MAFLSFLGRLRSSTVPICSRLRKGRLAMISRRTDRSPMAETNSLEVSRHKPMPFSWLASLVPVTLAVSVSSIFAFSNTNPSYCDIGADNPRSRGVSFGTRGSSDYVVEGIRKTLPQELINELKTICKDNMTMDYEERCFHGKPQNSFHKAINIPDVVVFPSSEDEVAKIVKSCNNHKVPIVPYGGATSIEGHTLSPNGGVCIDMGLMKHVKALHVADMDVVVEPGIGWVELNEYLEPYGLFFPLDPGPGATIGGMCATRCSGSLAVSM